MLNNNLNPFVGLKPYTKETSNFYFGREQEVENLLGVLQKNKLVTLSGASGTGKTSLINAGLIPRLKKGFVGQAGKDWSITSFRPGIEPLLNLSHALTASTVLKVDLKSNTTDRKYYSEIISNFGSLGIVEVYKRSEIFGKKNLLIIIDQLEDLYKYNKYFNHTSTEEDNTLMDLIYRTVTINNTAIYFLICIETSYLTKLTSYNKLQEIISKSQYSIQNIDHSGIHQIVKNTFYKKNIQFNHKVIDLVIDTLKEEIIYLPNLQLLLYKLYEKFVVNGVDNLTINLEDVEAMGGVKYSIANDFETIYTSSAKEEQRTISLFFKAIASPQNASNTQYESISNISEYTSISRIELSNKIRFLKKTFNELFDVFEPSITGILASAKKPYDSKNIISLKYIKFLNWKRHDVWLNEEENNYKNFKAFSEDAIRKSNNEVDFLKTPELENAIEWRDNPTNNKNWAKKYNLDFDKTLNFINKSEQDDNRIKKQKSDQLDREKRRNKYVRNTAILSAVIFLFLTGFGLNQADKAIKAKGEEKIERIKAVAATKKADSLTNEAVEDKRKAIALTEIAKKAQEKAEDERKKADNERTKANDERKKAVERKAEAIAALIKAKESDSIAKEESKIAKEESKKNKTLKELIELKSDFKDLTISLSSAKQENNFEKIKKLIDSSIVKQKRFNALKQHELIEAEEISGDESILELNQKILTVLKKVNSYGQTDMLLTKNTKNYSIRSFDVLNNQKIAYAGDHGEINFYDINKGTELDSSIKIVNNNEIEDRIRNLVYDNENILIATTFSGKVFKVNPQNNLNQAPDLIYQTTSEDGFIIDFFIDRINNKQYLITTKNIILFNSYNSPQTINLKFNNTKATYYLDSKLFVVSNNEVFVLDGKGNNYKVLLDIDSADMKLVDRIYVTKSYLFLGNKNGNIFWYDYKYDDVKNSKTKRQKDKFESHSSSITSIFLEEDKNFLFTASLDNKIFRYNLNYAPNLIRNSKTNLVGHNKWIWDMNTYTNKDDKKLLITADQDGNLLTWYIDPKDFLENIESRFKTFLNK
jgi:energy-coupling factor transporter ATP-binding protein EcfA2